MDRNTFLRRMLAGAFTFGLPASPALAQPVSYTHLTLPTSDLV